MTAGSKLIWLTPRQIYEHYLDEAVTTDGTPVLDVIEQCREQLGFEASAFEMSGAKAEDRPEYERYVKPIQECLQEVLTGVRKLMMNQAETGGWIAFGRCHPDAGEEIIPARYWPFLTLDIDNRVAKGDDMTFRAVHGLITRQIPDSHGIFDLIREAQRVPDTEAAPAAEPEPTPQPAFTLPVTGTPGRPSSMHLIRQEFDRRVESGTIKTSLNKESKALSAWLAAAHPEMPPTTAKAIANNLREAYRTAKQSI